MLIQDRAALNYVHMKNASFLLTIMFLLIIVLATLQVVISNKLSTAGVQLTTLYDNSAHYRDENEAIKTQLYSALSMASISAKAKELGFVVDSSPLVIKQKTRVALK